MRADKPRGLAERLDVGGEWPSIGIVEASVPLEVHEEELRRLDERARAESGAVSTYFAPEAFEWIFPARGRMPVAGPMVILRKTAILIRGIPEIADWVGKAIEIGFTAKAIAFRLSPSGAGWRIRKTPKTSGPYYRLLTPALVWAEIERRGFPVGQPLPARWDERSQMVVAVRPAKDERAQGRRAG